jgi:hypothetical protein
MIALLSLLLTSNAQAFCGFYVGGADQSLYNDATMVVMLRSGTTTVLSMQNNYQGPPSGFAMVVPVPQVLQKENVRILPRDVFAKVDTLTAPRLVEYWEQDPCRVLMELDSMAVRSGMPMALSEAKAGGGLGVTIEAQFEVGEYDVVILSARDSSGLDTWLRREKYNIPAGAEPVLRPYVQAGTKFFVAKVIPEKVQFVDGRAVLSPLRVNYESADFTLPLRLGLLNSKGEQDLIVHVLAPGQRYEAANYENTFIPTNLRVKDEVRTQFGSFYDAVFREVARPRTVVTEYSWDAGSCDPCPVPPLDDGAIATLGGDVVGDSSSSGFVLTRLHYRYGADGLSEDLVFRAAPPVEGGRGVPDADGRLSNQRATPSGVNNFQGRYVILHPWTGKVACDNPRRGTWGGPGGDGPPRSAGSAKSRLTDPAAVTSAPVALASVLLDGIPEGTQPAAAPAPIVPPLDLDEPSRCNAVPGAAASWLALGGMLAGLRRRRSAPPRR